MPLQFDAQAFDPGLPNGRCGGALQVEGRSLVFATEAYRLALPLQGLQLTLGGASDRLIFISHPAHPDCQCYTADHALLSHPALAGHPAVASLLRARRRHRQRVWASLAGGLAVLCLVPLVLYFSLDALSAALARRLPVAWEQSLGETAIKSFKVQNTFMADKDAAALLKPLVAPLEAQAGGRYRYRFHIVNDPSLNAFALPGGEVVIHSGLILKAQNPTQLQGVLAHEISHVTAQHGLRSILKSLGVYAVAQALIGDASGLFATLASAAPMLVNQKYSRDFEREADRQGVGLLVRAQIDPSGLVGFFRAIQQEESRKLEAVGGEAAQSAARSALAYLGTHPDTDERIARLQVQIKDAGARNWRNDGPAFAALQSRVEQFVGTTTTEEKEQSEDTDPRQ